jgi:hypothetical protein
VAVAVVVVATLVAAELELGELAVVAMVKHHLEQRTETVQPTLVAVVVELQQTTRRLAQVVRV